EQSAAEEVGYRWFIEMTDKVLPRFERRLRRRNEFGGRFRKAGGSPFRGEEQIKEPRPAQTVAGKRNRSCATGAASSPRFPLRTGATRWRSIVSRRTSRAGTTRDSPAT